MRRNSEAAEIQTIVIPACLDRRIRMSAFVRMAVAGDAQAEVQGEFPDARPGRCSQEIWQSTMLQYPRRQREKSAEPAAGFPTKFHSHRSEGQVRRAGEGKAA
jgi:hypothetical protein